MFKEKVLSTCQKFNLIPPGSKLLVALSGGPDSVALLNVLLELRGELQLSSLAAVHVNHQLRGAESERDEQFVKELCGQLGVPLFTERVTVDPKGKGVEAAARQERYRVFDRVLRLWKGDYVALGHTASDLAETVLLNLAKGTGIRGLRGFLPKRDRYVRPLFEVTRREVEEYLELKGLPYIVDSSNLSTDFERNLIRIEVVPRLRRLNPRFEEAVLRLTSTLRGIEFFLNSQVEALLERFTAGGHFCAPLEELLKLPEVLQGELLIGAVKRLTGKGLSFRKVEKCLELIKKGSFARYSLGNGLTFVVDAGRACILPEQEGLKPFEFRVTDLPAEIETPSGVLRFSLNRGYPLIPLKEFKGQGIIVRNRKPGDRVDLGRHTRPLKKLLNEAKVPVLERDGLPVVEFGGRVLYVPFVSLPRRELPQPFVGVEFEERKSSDSPAGD
ncbi:tRNA lysidine(34) synthetase TilS [Thermovibrio ammonificans]